MSRSHPSITIPTSGGGGPSHGVGPESKRDKKRREVIERVERHHLDKVAGRDQIYEDLYKDLTNRNALLSKDPSSSRPLDLPLYLLNLERDALLSSIEMHWEYRHSSLVHLHALERQRIEDDHRKGRELVRQRLLDGVEERRRKIREDKESVGDIVAETLMEAQVRPRPSRNARTQKRHLYGHSPPRNGSAQGSTNRPSSTANNNTTGTTTTKPDSHLANTVASADALLAALLPFTASHAIAMSTENIISPLPYSLAILPAPNPPAGTGGKTARRAGRGVNAYGGKEGDLGLDDGTKAGGGKENGTNPGGSSGKTNGPNNTVIRVGPTMSGYAKVQGWTPGKSLDELKGLVGCNEMEREGDLASIRGWGRRARGTTRNGGVAGLG